MLTAVKNNFKVFALSFKYNLMKEMVNKVSFIMNIVLMMANNSFFIIQWLVIFSLKDNICGLGFYDIMRIWAISASTFGFAHTFFYGVMDLNETITNGLLDTYLVQPKNVLMMVATSKTKVSAIGDLLYGYVIMLIINPSVKDILLFTLFTIIGGIIFTAFVVIVNCIAFVIPRSDGLSNSLVSILVSVSTYPPDIFKRGIQFIICFIIPAGLTVYFPTMLIQNFELRLFLVLLVVLTLYVTLAFVLFNKGLKRYSSACLMTPRT